MANENPDPTTYADWAKTRDPDGSTATIVELLSKTNKILEDAFVMECNMTEGHRTTVRSGIPRGTWRKLNYGVMPVKTQSRQVMDTPGYLENYIEVDKRLANQENDRAAYMLSESRGVMQGMNRDHVETLLYGDTDVTPERFMGFMHRYNSATAESSRNLINGTVNTNGTSTGDNNVSIYIMSWGPDSMFEFFPRGSNVGLSLTDLGEQTLFDANGGRFQGYRSHLVHDVGFCLRDWRYGARICNLDETEIAEDGVDLIKLLIRAVNSLEDLDTGNTVIYTNRAVHTSLDILANEKSNVALAMKEWGSEQIMAFRGIPIRRVDSIATELDVDGLAYHGGDKT